MCLALMILLEARGEPLPGQYAVGQVIMNRTLSDEYPDTICEVIKQPHQFAPIVYTDATIVERAVAGFVAADLYLNYEPNDEVLWFYNPNKANPRWAKRMKAVRRIGNHLFLRRKS